MWLLIVVAILLLILLLTLLFDGCGTCERFDPALFHPASLVGCKN